MSNELHFEALLHRVGKLVQFEIFKFKNKLKGIEMDPVTSIFSFLSTPAGQHCVEDLLAIGQDFVKVIGGLITSVHNKLVPASPSVATIVSTEPTK